MEKHFTIDRLKISVFKDAETLGKNAAAYVQKKLTEAIAVKGSANLILATGASQFTFLEALKKCALDWQKITVFHLDEYQGLPDTHGASFRKYLRERILNDVKPQKMYFLHGDAQDLDLEMTQYAEHLLAHPIDVACIGIGENGHIAFNDPPVADFNDPKLVKLVALDEDCRNQQLGEGWFATFDEVPTHALTLTVPAIMASKCISCVVPDTRKANAVKKTVYDEINTNCPATILRTHPDTRLFLDVGSAARIT